MARSLDPLILSSCSLSLCLAVCVAILPLFPPVLLFVLIAPFLYEFSLSAIIIRLIQTVFLLPFHSCVIHLHLIHTSAHPYFLFAV